MVDFLLESGRRSSRPAIVKSMMYGANQKYEEDQKVLMSLVDESTYYSHGFLLYVC